MKISKLILLSFLSTLVFASCSDDDPIDPINNGETAAYTEGFFVLNEGGSGEGTITFVSNDLTTVVQNVYSTVNKKEDLGLGKFLQSIFFNGDKAYIISNGTNLITVVNRYTFELVGKVDSGLNVPRYGVVENGKAYVTNQGDFTTTADDYVAVINLKTLEVEKQVLTGGKAEYILEENDKIYIQNAAYGTGNEVAVFDPANNTIVSRIVVGDQLNSIDIENNILYALTGVGVKTVDLSSGTVSTLAAYPDNFSAGRIEVEGQNIYYTSGDSVYGMAINATEVSTTPVLTYGSKSKWGAMYGFAVEDNRIYVAEGGDFASDSYVQIYTLDGSLLKEIPVGIAPNGFYFND